MVEEPHLIGENGETFKVDGGIIFSRQNVSDQLLLADEGFNSHDLNDGSHVSPYDEGRVDYGVDNLNVRLIQGIDEDKFAEVLARGLKATTGLAYNPSEYFAPDLTSDRDEMLRGGLQSALESQVLVFEITGASRALTHQLVRTRKAAFHQQSQRATWYGDRPNVRRPMSILAAENGRPDGTPAPVISAWNRATLACWEAYKAACDAGISYQDARYILPEGTTNYILCEYPVREFLNVYAYRACSMFLWEMVEAMREMGRILVQAHPFLEPHVKISCEKTGALCPSCGGVGLLYPEGTRVSDDEAVLYRKTPELSPDHVTPCGTCSGLGSPTRKCTFQGWENVEGACSFPWARQSNRTFLPAPKYRIGEK